MVNMELYRDFYTVAKCGSLTAAAKELFVSQPALSQSIARLETQLGGRLFVRTAHGMALTPEGELVNDYAERAISLLEIAQNSFEEMRSLVMGTLRIGASDTLCRHFLLPHIRRFHDQHPDVRIHVTNRTSADTLALLRAGKVDVAFVNLPIGEEEFNIRKCLPLQDGFAAAPAYKKLFITPEILSELPLIMMETASNTRVFFDRQLQIKGVRAQPEFELGSFDLVVEFAKAGLGIACITKEFIGDELESGELVWLSGNISLPPRSVGAATLRDFTPTFAATRFLDMMELT